MLTTRNNWLRELCQGISDVDYVVSKDSAKRSLISEQQYMDLEMLFSFNNAEKSQGRDPYVQILTDDSGASYALLSEECIKYVSSKGLSLILNVERHVVEDISNSSLAKLESGLTEEALESQSETLDGYLKLHYFMIPISQRILGDERCRNWKASDERCFLNSVDILGGYLN